MSDKITEESFLKDVAAHQMQVIREDGVHRHVRFKKPGTMCAHFDLVTWPGYLCYTGDMGTYVFRRLEDMFAFFRQKPFEKGDGLYINRGYWAEKIEAADRCGVKVFTTERFEKRLREELDEYISRNGDDWDEGYADELRERFADDVLRYADDGEYAGRQAAAEFEVDGEEVFTDLWEYDFTDWTFRYTWCCYALAWAVRQYDAAKAATQVKPEDGHRDYRDDDVCIDDLIGGNS